MKTALFTLFGTTALHSLVSANRFSFNTLPSTLSVRHKSPCENTATSRSCWGDYSIDTDWYTTIPSTGITRGDFNQLPTQKNFQLTIHRVLAFC